MTRSEMWFHRVMLGVAWLGIAVAIGGVAFILATEHGKHFH